MKQSPALKLLHEMATNKARQKYIDAGIDPNYSVAPVFKVSTANGLTKAVIKFLTLSGWQAERISTTGRPIDKRYEYTDVLGHRKMAGSVKWIPGTIRRGSADISSTIMGRSVKWEVKIKDKQSPDQKSYEQEIKKAGGYYFLIHNIDEFMEIYNKLIQEFKAKPW